MIFSELAKQVQAESARELKMNTAQTTNFPETSPFLGIWMLDWYLNGNTETIISPYLAPTDKGASILVITCDSTHTFFADDEGSWCWISGAEIEYDPQQAIFKSSFPPLGTDLKVEVRINMVADRLELRIDPQEPFFPELSIARYHKIRDHIPEYVVRQIQDVKQSVLWISRE